MMSVEERLEKVLGQALTGRGSHVLTLDALDALPWKQAGQRPGGAPHSIFEIVNHLVYWQEFALTWIDNGHAIAPEHAAESWPGEVAPVNQKDWEARLEDFRGSFEALQARLSSLDLLSERGPKTVLEILQMIASHNSYHVGQIGLLRRMLGEWPPPGGGATW